MSEGRRSTAGSRPAGERVCLGAIAGVHGVRGLVRVKPFTARPEDVAAYGPVEDEAGTKRFRLEVVGVRKGVALARIEGVATRDAAEALRGTRLWVARDVLPPPEEDEFYHADLIGLGVVTEDGRHLGRVRAVHDFGAGDVIEVVLVDGRRTTMVPFTREVVPLVDLSGGRLVVTPLPGMFDGIGGEEFG